MQKKAIEAVTPTKDYLELHVARAHLQVKLWLQSDKVQMEDVSPEVSIRWRKRGTSLEIVWRRLQPVPNTCLQLVTCDCKTKCSTDRCSCYKKGIWSSCS